MGKVVTCSANHHHKDGDKWEIQKNGEFEMKKTMYQPKTGKRCSCKIGMQRDKCPACEGTGLMIDFNAIREALKNKLDMNKNYRITSQKELRKEFWYDHPALSRKKTQEGDYYISTRIAFCDYIEALYRFEKISEDLADRATL